MDTKEIAVALEGIKDAEYNLSKFSIFNYDTRDEADRYKERSINGDVTVEIGGPGTHIKITVLTRAEHTKVKTMMAQLLNARLAMHQENLIIACRNILIPE